MFTYRASLGCIVGLSGVGALAGAGLVPAPDAFPIVATSLAVTASAVDEAARSPYHDLLVRAINERLLVQFTYGGHVRVCEPYAYGVGAAGEAILHTFQTAGSSASRPPPGWRTFTVSGIENMVLTQRRFTRLRAGFNEERPRLDPAWAEIVPPEEPAAELEQAPAGARSPTS